MERNPAVWGPTGWPDPKEPSSAATSLGEVVHALVDEIVHAVMCSVWFFESESGRRDAYYVNIEVPFTRNAWGITSSDLVFDFVIAADGSYQFKDEDALDFAEEARLFSAADAASIRHAAAHAIDDVEN